MERRGGGAAGGGIWVFGYGSLMWNPGFPHVEVRPARLFGYHRAFCLYSEHYRGTPERRGLVLGLDRGGSCMGRAFRVAAADADAALHYLIRREMFGHAVDVYVLKWLNVRAGRRWVRAACFVVNRAHEHYAGKLSPERIAGIVAGASGTSGTNRDYLANTLAHLDDLGIREGTLHRVQRLVDRKRHGPPP